MFASLVARRWVELRTEWRCRPGPGLGVARAVGDWHPFRVVSGRACCGLAGGFLLLRNFSVAISVDPGVCFVLILLLISMFLGCCICELGILRANRVAGCLRNRDRNGGEGWSATGWLRPPVVLLLAVPGRLFCFGSLVILDVVCRYLSIFLLYINIKIGGNRF